GALRCFEMRHLRATPARGFTRAAATDRIRRVRIGPINLATPFCQAGLAGYSDRAMRVVARRHGCPYAVTEALLDVILLSGGQGLRKSIDINEEDHPVAGQVMGSEPPTVGEQREALAEHFAMAMEIHGEQLAGRRM